MFLIGGLCWLQDIGQAFLALGSSADVQPAIQLVVRLRYASRLLEAVDAKLDSVSAS